MTLGFHLFVRISYKNKSNDSFNKISAMGTVKIKYHSTMIKLLLTYYGIRTFVVS